MSIFEMMVSPIKQTQPSDVATTPATDVTDVESPPREDHDQDQGPMMMQVPSLSPPIVRSKWGPNSPLKMNDIVKISINLNKRIERVNLTPNKMGVDANVESPSPIVKNLKFKQKSLKQLDKEYKDILKELKLDKPNDNNNDEDKETDVISGVAIRDIFNEDEEETTTTTRLTYGPKPKRRKIIRRLDVAENEQKVVPKNIHKELLKLKKRQVSALLTEDENHSKTSDLEDETTSEEEEKEDLPVKRQKKKRPKKYNLVSNNFRRLKLPRKNRRWPGRRR